MIDTLHSKIETMKTNIKEPVWEYHWRHLNVLYLGTELEPPYKLNFFSVLNKITSYFECKVPLLLAKQDYFPMNSLHFALIPLKLGWGTNKQSVLNCSRRSQLDYGLENWSREELQISVGQQFRYGFCLVKWCPILHKCVGMFLPGSCIEVDIQDQIIRAGWCLTVLTTSTSWKRSKNFFYIGTPRLVVLLCFIQRYLELADKSHFVCIYIMSYNTKKTLTLDETCNDYEFWKESPHSDE